jgi:hypothetical protein
VLVGPSNSPGGIHGIDMWYSKINIAMYCVDVATGIDTYFFLFIGNV